MSKVCTLQHLYTVSNGTDSDTHRAIKSARKAFNDTWAHNVTAKDRATMLTTVAQLLMKHQEELAAILTQEMVSRLGCHTCALLIVKSETAIGN